MERISTLLDQRQKGISDEECIEGYSNLQAHAIPDVKRLGDLFEGPPVTVTTPGPAAAQRSAPPPELAPLPSLATSSGRSLTPVPVLLQALHAAPYAFLHGREALRQAVCCWERGQKPKYATATENRNTQTLLNQELTRHM